MVKEQAGVISLQEKIIARNSFLLYTKFVEQDADKVAKQQCLEMVDEDKVDDTLEQAEAAIDYEPYLNKFAKDPFDFYGGCYNLSEMDKKKMMKDKTIRFYEARLIELQNKNAKLQEEMEQLIWLNNSSDHSLIDA